jgi:hypothetical protein
MSGRHVPQYELRGGSGLANWLEFVSLSHPTALLTVGTRAYEVRRIAGTLTRGHLTMKKPSTQILEVINEAPKDADGNAILSPALVEQITKLTTSLDRRDQQYRVGKKPVKKAAAKKKAKARK